MSAMRHGAERRSGNTVTSSTSGRVALDSTRWGWGRSSGERHSDSDGLGQSEPTLTRRRGGSGGAEGTTNRRQEMGRTRNLLFLVSVPRASATSAPPREAVLSLGAKFGRLDIPGQFPDVLRFAQGRSARDGDGGGSERGAEGDGVEQRGVIHARQQRQGRPT